MRTQEIVHQAVNSREVCIEFNPRTGFCNFTGVDEEGAFYIAISKRAFRALKRQGIITLRTLGEDGPEVWRFVSVKDK